MGIKRIVSQFRQLVSDFDFVLNIDMVGCFLILTSMPFHVDQSKIIYKSGKVKAFLTYLSCSLQPIILHFFLPRASLTLLKL